MRSAETAAASKKKFGKNLNKLVRAPPIAKGPSGTSNRSNGLLLLSTKKGTSSTTLSKPAAPAPANSKSSLAYESKAPSTHDVLLSAIANEPHQPPQAWNVQQLKEDTPKQVQERSISESEPEHSIEQPPWKEYAGTHTVVASDDQQRSYMVRLARERAEIRRSQEETKVLEQKERAAERLRELDSKTTPSPLERRTWDMTRSGTRALWEPDQVDDNLNQKNSNDGAAEESPVGPQLLSSDYNGPVIQLSSYEDRDRGERKDTPRMLFDPKSGSMVEVKTPEMRKKLPKKKKEKVPDMKMAERSKHVEKSEEVQVKLLKPERKLPRTCGVLYARDAMGNLYSMDDCEGDLGYGAHSVPGGRTKNPTAYAEFLSQHRTDLERILSHTEYSADSEGSRLHTGFIPSDEDHHPEPVEYKPGEKLELVTGEESSTLKPTAKEWAPSQAALAAAVAGRVPAEHSFDASDDDADGAEENDDEEDDGLGFDPTQDMDFVMQSPSHDDSRQKIESIALSALALEPAVFSASASTDPRHIFAFGSSGPWSLGEIGGVAAGDWNIPNVGDAGSLFGAGALRNISEANQDNSSSYLSIPTSNSWGSPSFGSLLKGDDSKAAAGD